jgi:hypothetical protein
MLYLTYNINTNEDGLAAQYQRIIGIICIAMHYNIKYVHTKIKHMEHIENCNPKEKNSDLSKCTYLNHIEDYFGFAKNFDSVDDYTFDEIVEESHPTHDSIQKYINSDQNILMKIYLPYTICEANVTIYTKAMPLLRSMMKSIPLKFYSPNDFNIAVHVRRGDVSQVHNNNRYASTEQVMDIINNLRRIYQQGIIYIFTEITEENKNEFDSILCDNIILKANEDVIDTLNHLINADVLVLGKSSFSYLAGLYNPNIVYNVNFWHTPMPNWINVDNIAKVESFQNIKVSSLITPSTSLYKFNSFNNIILLLIFTILIYLTFFVR